MITSTEWLVTVAVLGAMILLDMTFAIVRRNKA
ncbi:MAG: TerC family protein, partial [Actinobacteria bacterium]|nr:TerC family protein [Actinomycetota bacterium]